MANTILMAGVIIFALVMSVVFVRTAYLASGNRPDRMDLAKMNDSDSAIKVDLEPYLPLVTGQFPRVLGLKSNG